MLAADAVNSKDRIYRLRCIVARAMHWPQADVLHREKDFAILNHKLEHGPKRRGAGNDLLRGQRWSFAIGILAAEYTGAQHNGQVLSWRATV